MTLDPDTVRLDAGILFGGSPARIMRLSPAGQRAFAELEGGWVRSEFAGTLARVLSDAGMLHPCPPPQTTPVDATVLIPVRDRPVLLGRCLAALGGAYPVIVVDDGSDDPAAVATVASAHGAKLVRRDRNGGAAAARNTGLEQIRSEIVVMVDSDCVPVAGWIERLGAHLADPLVAVAAPRIVATAAPTTTAARYNSAGGSLDLGDREARVAPLGRVAYVPTAALVVRRAALLDVARGSDVFDPLLHCGEDVDLIWRLHDAGWRIRYDPSVHMRHHEPETWRALLQRRFHYGTSAAPLAQRHPAEIPPLIVHPLPALTVAALLARRPVVAAAAFTASVVTMRRTLRKAQIPARGVVPAMATAVHQTWLGAGRYVVQFASPLLVAALVAPGPGSARRRWGRRAAIASLLLGPAVHAWRTRRPPLDPARYIAGSLADDIAYGAGVWRGVARTHNMTALRPVIVTRPLRIPSKENSS